MTAAPTLPARATLRTRAVVRVLGACGLFALLLLAQGCVRSIQPILKDDQVIEANDLLGKWVTDDGKQLVDVQPGDQANVYRVSYTDEGGKKGAFLGRIGKVGELQLIELQPEDPMPAASDVYRAHLLKVYSFLLVRQTKPRLVISTMSVDWLKKYVDAHPGDLQTISPTKDDLIVTSPTADFQRFLLQHWKDDGAFGDPGTFVRPGDPATRPAAP
ncbi:MAG TPA: hypothetical protein VGI81_27640 [Tepidisphaeraceae bacterium]|jgi:hypothetical protein